MSSSQTGLATAVKKFGLLACFSLQVPLVSLLEVAHLSYYEQLSAGWPGDALGHIRTPQILTNSQGAPRELCLCAPISHWVGHADPYRNDKKHQQVSQNFNSNNEHFRPLPFVLQNKFGIK